MDTPKSKPDMLAASPRQRGGKRILATLEHGVKPAAKPPRASAWAIDGWTVGLGLLLLLMFGVAWMMHEKTITPSTFKHVDGGARRIAAAPRAETQAAPTAEQAATIVNETPASAAVAPLGATDANQAATAGSPDPTVQDAQPRGVQPPPKAVLAGSTTTPRAPLLAATQVSAAAAARKAMGATSVTRNTGDTDVTLLAALVAHANQPTVTLAERSRDVVERKEGDTTAQLLARCQQLGLIEGMLCRSRICAGRWDADAACRAPAH